jgi:hypothetical protein
VLGLRLLLRVPRVLGLRLLLRMLGILRPRLILRVVGPWRSLVVVDLRLRRLVLHVRGRHARLRHGVTALAQQALVDRQVIASG